MFTLTERTALVTGPTGCVGMVVVKKLLEAGMRVVLMSDKYEKSREYVKKLTEYGENVIASRAGMREPEFCEKNLANLYEKCGSIDVLVILNGREPAVDNLVDIEQDKWDDMMSTHLKAPMMFMQKAKPYLEKSKAPRIILISGMESLSGELTAGMAYATAKGGVISLTRTAAHFFAPKGITVNCVAPGGIYNLNSFVYDETTSNVHSLDHKKTGWSIPRNDSLLGRACRPEDVAAAVEFLASEEAGFITGEVINVNGGMYMC